MYDKILALLARVPADHWGLDLAAIALVALGCGAVLLGVLTPDQLPAALDAALYVLGLVVPAMAARAAALKVRASAGTKAALAAVAAVKARDEVATIEAAVEVANVVRLPSAPKEGA